MRRIWPKSVQTVGGMREAEDAGSVQLKMSCGQCGGFFKVPVRLIAAAYGPGYSLIGRRVACPKHGCSGSCVVLFRWPGTNPFVSLSG